MSPSNAMERSYTSIKEMLRTGVFVSGARLEANRLAYELGVSVTPVRDVLYRLAGEQLVDATIGEGFHVPRFSESALRDLYEWHSALLLLASRTVDIRTALAAKGDTTLPVADRTAAMFERIASIVPNREICSAMLSASDRLQPFRLVEIAIFADVEQEFDAFSLLDATAAIAVRRYHLRRMRAVSELLPARDRR